MNRRAFLVAIGAAGTVAGCLETVTGDRDTVSGGASVTTTTSSGADDTTSGRQVGGDGTRSYDTSVAAQGIPSTICSEAIQPEPGIYAIDDPAVAADWTGRTIPYRYHTAMAGDDIAPDHNVVGLETEDGRARAYPLEILAEHEIVNDDFGDPVIVTFCPICRSGMVADAVVDGEPTTFAVSGLLWQPERLRVADAQVDNRTFGAERTGGERVDVRHGGNLVMYDLATDSYWSQILARGICGPETGTYLTIRPSTLTTWGEWQREHPDTDVVLPRPYSETYTPDQYAGRTPVAPDS